ncbi:type I restriction endonuclease subunit R [Micromonospora sp. IBSANI012]|uniref:type I restriction endonuclease subunit R n=1 Tax=Micromonospora sp. IBSANI012 TaxID=3457761 RepID=UPI0040587725
MSGGPEYAQVELPLLTQLTAMGWSHIEGSKSDPGATGRSSFRETILQSRLRAALRTINLNQNGEPWLDDHRLSQAVASLTRPKASKLIEINEELTERLLLGSTVDGVEGWDRGRDRTVQFIDWERPERNEFLVINQFRVDEPGGQQHKYIAPDLVLFVNGIPLVVVEAKAPGIVEPMVKAIEQLRRYANQRGAASPEGNERLFHLNQFVVASCFERAMVGTFTSEAEHFAEWKTTEPTPEADVAAALHVPSLSSQQRLAAGMLHPERLLDLVRHFTLFMPVGSRTVKIAARYQQYRAVRRAIDRLCMGKTRAEDGEQDRRGGIVWHTQGSGKSLTMVFLVRAMRTHRDLVRFKVVVVTDRTDLQRQLSETANLTGETVYVGKSVAGVRQLLVRPGKALVFAMIQKYRNPQARKQDAEALQSLGVLDRSQDIVVLVDEAHRSHGSALHAHLLEALPNCARIGFTGTPIIMGKKKFTHAIFGDYLDQYTILESQEDGATVPILYEGRTVQAAVRDARDLDEVFDDMFVERSADELEAIKRRWATKGNVLEAPKLIQAKARNMLRHYVDVVLPNGFKAQVVASTRRATVRFREALLVAREQLVAELDDLPAHLRTADAADRADQFKARTARLVRAWPYRDLIARLEFIPVISGAQNDKEELARWTDKDRQEAVIDQFKLPLSTKEADPGRGSPVAFLIVKSMLLTGFDAPVEQVLYLDRHIKEAELLQAIARVNRTAARKRAGYVVDYFGVADNLKSALAAYAEKDIEGALSSVVDEVPLLAERHQRVRNLFLERGIDRFDAEADQEACVQALADERLRAAFEAALKQFTTSLETVLPRPEALPHVPGAKTFGAIALTARRRYRDDLGFDPSLYGEKVRRLIDDHIEALGIDQKIPPISITATDFDEKVAGLRTDRAKASEMEHAIRHHLRGHLEEDPEYYGQLSERLEEIIQELGDQWDQLVLALGELLPQVRAGRQSEESGLDPQTEAPFYDILKREASDEGRALTPPTEAVLRQVTIDLVQHIKLEIRLVGFWHNPHAQNTLRNQIIRMLDDQRIDGGDLFDFDRLPPLADRLVELAKANRARLVTAGPV